MRADVPDSHATSYETGRDNMRRITASTHRALIVIATGIAGLGACMASAGADEGGPSGATATPIKHLIVVIGENRGFDHIFATYRPRGDQQVGNLLSRGIADENGMPGPNFRRA